jgi:hypothetical protein
MLRALVGSARSPVAVVTTRTSSHGLAQPPPDRRSLGNGYALDAYFERVFKPDAVERGLDRRPI